MRDEPLYPLRFQPIIKRILWGGRRLGTLLHKPIGPERDYAESWEISDHGTDVSRVAGGPLEGVDLHTLVVERTAELLGPSLGDRTQFPLLMKFLDAHQKLSVQVHPDDATGRRLVGDNGKTEAWVILHAEPGSLIYAGLNPGTTRERFEEALRRGEVEPLLHRFEPAVGDCVFIPAGTVHAIGEGILLAEIQQMSDATFRVFDWNRVGSDGKPRPLHIAEALESIDFETGPIGPVTAATEPCEGGRRQSLIRCPYFALDRWLIGSETTLGNAERFTLVVCVEGEVSVQHAGREYDAMRGVTLLLPAAVGPCRVVARRESVVLSCTVP